MFLTPYMDVYQTNLNSFMILDMIKDGIDFNTLIRICILPIFISIYMIYTEKFKKYFINGFLKYIKFFWTIIWKKEANIEFEICLTRLNHTLRIESDDGYNAIRYFIFKNYQEINGFRNLRKIPKVYKGELEKVEYKCSFSKICFKDLYIGNNLLELPNGLFLKCTLDIQKQENKDTYDNAQKFYFTSKLICSKYKNMNENMSCLIKNYENMMEDYFKYLNNQKIENQYCYIYDNHHLENPYFNKLYIGQEYRSFDGIFFPEKDKFLESMDFFLNNKDYYMKKGKPYRKIILAHGEPGCGKTSIILGLINLLDKKYGQKRQLIHLNLDKLSKKNLQNILFDESVYVNDSEDGKETIPFNRRIYYIEEIDGYKSTLERSTESNQDIKKTQNEKSIVKNTEKIIEDKTHTCTNIQKEDPLKVQDFIELLDGPMTIKNSEIIIMTTNFINKIDKALIRPGRVNHLIHMKRSTNQDLKNILNFYFEENITDDELDIFEDYDFTPATISELCNVNINSKDVINGLLKKKSVIND